VIFLGDSSKWWVWFNESGDYGCQGSHGKPCVFVWSEFFSTSTDSCVV